MLILLHTAPLPALIVTISVLGAAFACGFWPRRAERKRLNSIEKWALENGLHFTKDGPQHLVIPCPSVFFTDGDMYVYNLTQGEWHGREFMGFDYSCRVGKVGCSLSAVVIGSDRPLKHLFIRPEGIADRVWKPYESEELNFESAQFNNAFYVSANDRKWAYDVIHPRMMEFLLSQPRFMIAFGPKHVIVFHERIFTVPEFQQAAELASGILDRLPEYIGEESKV